MKRPNGSCIGADEPGTLMGLRMGSSMAMAKMWRGAAETASGKARWCYFRSIKSQRLPKRSSKDGDRAVGFMPRLLKKAHAVRKQRGVIAGKVIGFEKQENLPPA